MSSPLAAAVVELHELADDGQDVLPADHPRLAVLLALGRELDLHLGRGLAQRLVELVSTNAGQVVSAEVEEEAVDERARVVDRGRVARAQLLVDLDEGLVLGRGRILLEGLRHERVLRVVVDRREGGRHLRVIGEAHRAQECGDRDLALAVDLDAEKVLVRRLELEPGAAVRDHLGGEQHPAGGRILGAGVVDARRAHELADHDPLGAVDDEGALVGHPREVAHEDDVVLDLVGLLDDQVDLDLERPRVRQVAGAALVLGELGLVEPELAEVELEVLTGEVGDRSDFVEELAEAAGDEPLEGFGLGLDQVREGEDLRNV